jgi:hypothetical protein
LLAALFLLFFFFLFLLVLFLAFLAIVLGAFFDSLLELVKLLLG